MLSLVQDNFKNQIGILFYLLTTHNKQLTLSGIAQLHFRKRLLQVGNDIINMFNADGQTD